MLVGWNGRRFGGDGDQARCYSQTMGTTRLDFGTELGTFIIFKLYFDSGPDLLNRFSSLVVGLQITRYRPLHNPHGQLLHPVFFLL